MRPKYLRNPQELFFWVLSAYTLNKTLITLAEPVFNFVRLTWLINYDSGFTKRGLLGAIIKNIGDSGSALGIIEIVVNLLVLALVTIYFSIIYRYRSDIYITLILILSPTLIMFPLNDTDVPGRVEMIGMIITAINCLLIRGTLKYHNSLNVLDNGSHPMFRTYLTLIVPVFLLSLLMFAHEATLLLSVPINFLITYVFLFNRGGGKKGLRSLLYAVFAYVPVGLSFLIILLNKNDNISHAYDICHNINSAFPRVIRGDCLELPYILKMHVTPFFPDTIVESLHIFYTRLNVHVTFVVLGLFLSIFSIKVISAVFHFENAKISLLTDSTPQQPVYHHEPVSAHCPAGGSRTLGAMILYFFILPFLCTLPLYVIAIDWGRWIATLNLQFVLTSLIFLNSDNFPLMSFPFIKKIHLFHKENTIATTPINITMLSLFILVCFLLRLPHYAKKPHLFLSPDLWQAIKHYL